MYVGANSISAVNGEVAACILRCFRRQNVIPVALVLCHLSSNLIPAQKKKMLIIISCYGIRKCQGGYGSRRKPEAPQVQASKEEKMFFQILAALHGCGH